MLSEPCRPPSPRRHWWLTLALVFAAAGVTAWQSGVAPTSGATLITGARILDAATGRYLPPASVLIENGRITRVSATEPDGLAPDVRRLSLRNATLVPGLIDARAGVAPVADNDSYRQQHFGLAHGVTGYRVLNVRATWGVAQRRRIDAGRVVAPRLWIGGRGFGRGAVADLRLIETPDARWAAAEAARQIADGVDWLAGFDGLSPELHRALVAAVKGTTVRVASMPGASSMADLAAAGVHSIEGLAWPLAGREPSDAPDAIDRAWADASARDLNALALRLARARVYLVPMAASYAPSPTGPGGSARASASAPAPTPAVARRAWAARRAFLVRFVRAGGRVVTGSGFDIGGRPPGIGTHAELAALVAAGLTPAEAIRAATVNAAALVGAERTLGIIAAGRDADIIIVEGDPLADVTALQRLTHVVRRGEVLDPDALRSLARD